MKQSILIFCGIFSLGISGVFGANIPFTDVSKSDPYYEPVRELYNEGVISDNGDHLFRPNDLMTRDFYVSLAVGVGCKKCETPSVSDIMRYQNSPFVDLSKINPYYYCIAYAADEGITQGYPVNTSGIASCEKNSTTYTTPPFCGNNSISRIEAVAILLRRANLWNENLNSANFEKTLTITDVSSYWFGYAQKGIQAGILTLRSNNTIGQDEKITRGEFAFMAAKILHYNQCNTKNEQNSVEAQIGIINEFGTTQTKTNFDIHEAFTLIPVTSTGTWTYEWTAKNIKTGEVRYFSGKNLPGQNLGEGSWIIDLFVRDKNNKIVSHPYIALTIGNVQLYTGDILLQNPNGQPITSSILHKGDKNSLIATNTGEKIEFFWTLVDSVTGEKIERTGKIVPLENIHRGEWIVTMKTQNTESKKITDVDVRSIQIVDYLFQNSNNTTSSITNILTANKLLTYAGGDIQFISINEKKTSYIYNWDFGDGNIIGGTDSMNHVFANPGIYTVILTITDSITGQSSQSSLIVRITGDYDTDRDGVLDSSDACPKVKGLKDNFGCPIFKNSDYGSIIRAELGGTPASDNDSDGDGIKNLDDFCPYVVGLIEFSGCPILSVLSGIGENICLAKKAEEQGIILGNVVCSTCPCDKSITYNRVVRSCDVLFPTILSPDSTQVYTRGAFYLVP